MKVSEITKKEVQLIKTAFECLDKALELMDVPVDSFTEKELKKYHTKKTVNMIELSSSLAQLKHYEVTYESFVRFVDDERCIKILAEGYEEAKGYPDINFIRLADKAPGSERKARKQLEKLYSGVKKQPANMAKAFFPNEDKTAEEMTYFLRDWLIFGIDDLIEQIEPARQEYIISKRGKVDNEEVERYLKSHFVAYEAYSRWIISRREYEIAYYPNLRLD